MTSTVIYLGALRTEATHSASSQKLTTDAPKDNQGKGEAFSPTDTVATALASCLLTIMGIKARDLNIDLQGTKAEVHKIMGTTPRRITEIKIDIHFSNSFDDKIKTVLERAARTCPVANSLHPDLKQNLSFIWPD
ncbi:MAG TPA: osmotically inducible protein OsmC [Flavobacteriaceae bacterium]|nr:osmotically inducible protein OsmC [Flavobacteriaceae bacterium]